MKKVNDCLEYLASTDEQLGKLKASAKYYAEFLVKHVKAREFLRAKGNSNPVREANAITTEAFRKVMEEKKEVDEKLETIIAKRKTCELNIEVWRSQSANRRQGNIT